MLGIDIEGWLTILAIVVWADPRFLDASVQ